jgi:hypothetical protein
VTKQERDTGDAGHAIPIVGPYFLVSFAPSSGVGVYEYLEVTHRFDALPGSLDRTGRKFDAKGQIGAGIYFNSLDELLTLCRREYLKDKKNTCYSTLFTTQPNKAVCAKILQFLNEPRLSGIKISRIVLTLLRDVADSERVAAVVAQAHEMRLENVKACLATEFQDIVLAPSTLEFLRAVCTSADLIASSLKEYGERATSGPSAQASFER